MSTTYALKGAGRRLDPERALAFAWFAVGLHCRPGWASPAQRLDDAHVLHDLAAAAAPRRVAL